MYRNAINLVACLAVALAVCSTESRAEITVVDSDSHLRNSSGTGTITGVQVSGTHNLLLVGVAGKSPNQNVTGSWGSTSLGAPIVSETESNWIRMFVLSNLTPGTTNLSVTVPEGTGGERFQFGFVSLSCTAGFDPLDAKGSVNDGPTTISITFDTAATSVDFVFGVAAADGNPASTSLATNLFSATTAYPGVGMTGDYDEAPSGTTFSWSQSGATADFAVGAVLVREHVPPGTVMVVR